MTSIDGKWRVDSEGVWLCPEHQDAESLEWMAVNEAGGALCEACGLRANATERDTAAAEVARALHNHTGIDEIDWDAAARIAIDAFERAAV